MVFNTGEYTEELNAFQLSPVSGGNGFHLNSCTVLINISHIYVYALILNDHVLSQMYLFSSIQKA